VPSVRGVINETVWGMWTVFICFGTQSSSCEHSNKSSVMEGGNYRGELPAGSRRPLSLALHYCAVRLETASCCGFDFEHSAVVALPRALRSLLLALLLHWLGSIHRTVLTKMVLAIFFSAFLSVHATRRFLLFDNLLGSLSSSNHNMGYVHNNSSYLFCLCQVTLYIFACIFVSPFFVCCKSTNLAANIINLIPAQSS
jgi:hypothetical protein